MSSQEMDNALSAISKISSADELLNLNRTVCDRLKTIRAREAFVIKSSLNEGDEVAWVGRRGPQNGSVVKVMRKFAKIQTANGIWRVPMNMLKKLA